VWHGVRGAVPASVSVTPSAATTASIGGTVNFNAQLFDASGNVITPTSSPTWSSENTAVATVDPSTGQATAQSSGQAAIKATYDGLSGYGVITVAATGSPAVDAFANMPVPSATGMWDVWGPSSGAAVAVGNSGTIWRYDGTSWSADPQSGALTSQTLYSVAGTSANDVHAVGGSGSLLHYNGSVWSAEPNPFGTGVTHFRVWAATPTAAFAVGTNGYVLKWDGSVWDTLPQVGGPSNTLIGVWASSANDVWVVGSTGTIRRWDGSQWNSVTHTLGTTQLNAIWGTSANNVYVVGGSSMAQCNASSCTTLAAPGLNFLWDVWGTSTNEVFVAAASSQAIGRWNGGGWGTVYSGYGGFLRAVFGTSNGTVFAAGENTAQPILRGARGAPVESYGYPTQFAQTGGWGGSYVHGLAITVSDTLVVTHLGLIVSTAGTNVKIGLYTDGGGVPGTVITQGTGSVAATGVREFPVTQAVVLPGTYWIVANFESTTWMYGNTSMPITYRYQSYAYANPLPSPFPGAPASTSYQAMNYYAKGFRF